MAKPTVNINQTIRAKEVRVVGADSEQLGILPLREALALAESLQLDLVEVSPTAVPPVCRIMDYGKFKYQQAKKLAEAKKKQVQVELKEVKLRPKTDTHDLEFKVKHVRRFLEEGNKAKITVVFRGREITHQELGMAALEKVAAELADIALVEVRQKMEGRSMFMIVAPKVKK
ncbi:MULTISPECIES: translation initiation factor IF-3 [Geomonas]|uniref:Translation initiation factor IF-3 n=2 Tax=Geomonas TaxID=2651583 RepID=A0ABX8JSX6_9BACT|nr:MULTISPECIES: translation initiation factor IF-3 [Geomonas]MBU5638945.1 translation initiation factor IF-3 [Geomonas diazotrophica]QWV99714.1 translation initiation factor IF-3 [Geomonas nitrogeniifigens]QXE88849.1 translation initiation factor IF-3 [Geomonas nitrogeniifigens]QXE93033.1 translation initiation factor IF-3 [Geomonas subterranea]QXM11557.1 translation initiation factor IF-3 [Geomonas subterranea]